MPIDKKIQLKILEELRAAYPETVDFQSRAEYADPEFHANLVYLNEHGYIDGTEDPTLAGPTQIMWASITADGLDFLKEAEAGINWKTVFSFLNNGWVVTVGAGLVLVLLTRWLWQWLGWSN
jgi:hypothetical protein